MHSRLQAFVLGLCVCSWTTEQPAASAASVSVGPPSQGHGSLCVYLIWGMAIHASEAYESSGLQEMLALIQGADLI